MENIEVIISCIGTALGMLITAATFAMKFIRSVKAKKAAENLIKIGQAIIPYIEQAEFFAHFTGEEKKEYVMTRANRFALENGIDFNYAEVSGRIEELVKLTKQVNAKNCADANKAKIVLGNMPVSQKQ